jgi:hypothetical protein
MPPEVPPEFAARSARREAEMLDLVRQHDPAAYEELMRIREEDPGLYGFALQKAARTIRDARADPEAAERMRKVRELEARIDELAEGYADLSGSEKKKRRAEVEKIAGELFDLKQTARREQLEDVRAKLAELEKEIAERDANRKQVIERFVDERLEDTPGL